MSNAFDLLNSGPVDLDEQTEAKGIIEFADNVVQEFYLSLMETAGNPVEHEVALLLVSYDKISFGKPPEVGDTHLAASSTEAIASVILCPERTSTKTMLQALSCEEHEMRVALILVLINLRHREVGGKSAKLDGDCKLSIRILRAMLQQAFRLVANG